MPRIGSAGWLRVGAMCAALLICAAEAWGQGELTVKKPRCEWKVDPMGIDVAKPRFSWELESADKNVMQSGYELQVARSEKELEKGKVIWESGEVKSDASVGVEYAGPALVSEGIYFWRVKVWDNHGRVSGWSTEARPEDRRGIPRSEDSARGDAASSGGARFEMGLLKVDDWKANWITPNLVEDETRSNPAPMLRKEFTVNAKKKIEKARLYASAMGLYEMELNGKRVGDQYFTPGWTAYDFRIQYQTYDVTGMVKSGTNCLGAMLGDGWFRGHMAFEGNRNNYGKKLALLAQLVITYTDGTQEIVASDGSWKAATGAVLVSDIYDGETYDARLEKNGMERGGIRRQGVEGVP